MHFSPHRGQRLGVDEEARLTNLTLMSLPQPTVTEASPGS
jgi:hypothetical protein